MKLKGVTAVAVIGIGMMLTGCSDPKDNPYNQTRGFWENSHQLRKMFVKDVKFKKPAKGSFSGGFFLLLGGVSGKYEGEKEYAATYVRFAWEIEDNTYHIATLPLEKIRIKIVENIKTPTVSFFLNEYRISRDLNPIDYSYTSRILKDYYNPQPVFEEYLKYVTVTCKDSDWPTEIKLPLDGKFGGN